MRCLSADGPGTSGSQMSSMSFVPQAFQKIEHANMTKVPSLVFDLELEDCDINAQSVELSSDAAAEDVALLQRFLAPSSAAQQKLAEDVAKTLGDERCVDNISLLAQRLTSLGYSVQVRQALGGGSDCLRNLRHSFVTVSSPGLCLSVNRATRYIVDPHFREQFEIGKPTERYAAILEVVPPCLIISQENISRLVSFMCSEINSAFKASNAVVPPWRQLNSMSSKWLPRNSLALTFTIMGNSQAEPMGQGFPQRGVAGVAGLSRRPDQFEPRKVFSGGNFRTVSAIM